MKRARGMWIGLGGAVTVLAAVTASAGVIENGTNLNGTNLNGTNLNGTNLNGTNLNGTNLNGATLAGTTLTNVHLEGSQLVARRGNNGALLSGADLVSARLTGSADNGAALSLRIDAVSVGGAPNDDLYYYLVRYQHADGSWDALCTDAAGNPAAAIALAGIWNYAQGVAGGGAHVDDSTRFTFACKRGALAKCTEWGYKPWRSSNGVSLAPYHQTCTRVVRADYCGDGVSHTVDGQLVDLYDRVGVQSDDQSWVVEASWDPNGARAYNALNRSHLDLIYRLSCGVPVKLVFDTDWEFAHGALIVDETPLGSDM